MSFFVVEFQARREIAVISHAWYMGNNLAAWPSLKPSKFKHYLLNHILPPIEDYKIIEIVIVNESDDYQTARKFEKRAEYELKFTFMDQNNSLLEKKRKIKRVIKRFSSSSESNCGTSSEIDASSVIVSPLDSHNIDSVDVCGSAIIASSDQKSEKKYVIFLTPFPCRIFPPFPSCNKPAHPPFISEFENLLPLRQWSEDFREIQEMLKLVISKMTTIEEFVRNASSSMKITTPRLTRAEAFADLNLTTRYNFKLPITSSKMFIQLNTDLSENSRLISLIDLLSHIHRGTCMQQYVRRISAYVFARNFAPEMNWIGANGKIGLAHTYIASALINAVRSSRNYPYESIGSVVHCMQRWLHCASDRNGGRTARRINSKKRNADVDNSIESQSLNTCDKSNSSEVLGC